MIRASWLLAAVTLMFAPPLLDAQDTYTIKVKVGGKGVMTIVTKEESEDNRTVITLPDGKVIKQTDAKKKLTKYRQEILEQEAGQWPSKVRRVYEKALVTKPDGKTVVKEEPFHGKTLLIAQKDGKPTFQIEGGAELAAKEVTSLVKEFSKKGNPAKEMELVLPKKAVAVGESWKLDKKGIKKLLGAEDEDDTIFAGFDFDKASATGKLVKAYKKDGRQFGIVQYEVMVPITKVKELEFKPGAKLTAKLIADACIDGSADTGVLRANFQMKGEATGPMGILVHLDVSGSSVESTQEVTK
jgi:hypothetical protein